MIPRTLVLKPLPTTQPQWKPKLLELRGMLAVLATLQKQAFCCDLDWVIIIMYHYYYCQQFGMFSKMVILQMRLATTTDTRRRKTHSLPKSQNILVSSLYTVWKTRTIFLPLKVCIHQTYTFRTHEIAKMYVCCFLFTNFEWQKISLNSTL